MGKLTKLLIATLMTSFCIFLFAGCVEKPRLDVRKISYLEYSESTGHTEFYVITSDRKVTQYTVDPDDGKTYDYFAGELPPGDRCKVTEFEIDEQEWTSIVNVLTRVDFMTLLDEFTPPTTEDGITYYMQVETADGVHKSGGYEAGFKKDPESRRFSEARQEIARPLHKSEQADYDIIIE